LWGVQRPVSAACTASSHPGDSSPALLPVATLTGDRTCVCQLDCMLITSLALSSTVVRSEHSHRFLHKQCSVKLSDWEEFPFCPGSSNSVHGMAMIVGGLPPYEGAGSDRRQLSPSASDISAWIWIWDPFILRYPTVSQSNITR
jgi:hypothetical protein